MIKLILRPSLANLAIRSISHSDRPRICQLN
ncbi:hypothetical protein CIPAW_08G112100 [Carya illinoinensis]|uniref:Uncharacterized protein n=1 Tax=Carya illinoinensis TaxID=32201 RepID=A0A8T1PSS5_CARIL|nr:hypothetical protein CIPAW_08G112100 [Carya illinoinensis]